MKSFLQILDFLHDKLAAILPYKDEKILSIYFGLPGSGKSTFAAFLARRCQLHKIPVYCNFPVIGCLKYDASDLGKYQIEDCKVIIDEAGIEFNNRDFKSFSKENLSYFKLHRHYGCSVDVFSQTYNDMDKKIRGLAQRLFLVQRSLIPYFIAVVPIRKKIRVDEQTHDIVDGYYIYPPWLQIFLTKRIFAPAYWKMFDSYAAPKLPHKAFYKYTKR